MELKGTRLVTRVAQLIAIIFGVYSIVRLPALIADPAGEFVSYYTAGYGYLHGHAVAEFYQPDGFLRLMADVAPGYRDFFYPNPPTLAIVFAPLGLVDFRTARFIWNGVNILISVLIAAVLIRESGLASEYLWIFIATVLAFQATRANLSHGQVYGAITLILIFVWKAIRRTQLIRAGAMLAVLMVFKLFGAWVWLLALRPSSRRLGFAAALWLGGIIGLSLLTLSVNDWQTFVARSVQQTYGSPTLFVTVVQSINGLFNRLFTFDAQFNPRPMLPIAGLGFGLSALATLAMTAWAAWMALREYDRDLTFAALCILCVVASPFAQDYTYIVMLVPIAICLRHVQAHPTRWGFSVVIISLMLISASYPFRSPVIADGVLALLAYAKVYGAVMLFIFTVVAAHRQAKTAAVKI
jgi:Glycosyltransferase family 87